VVVVREQGEEGAGEYGGDEDDGDDGYEEDGGHEDRNLESCPLMNRIQSLSANLGMGDDAAIGTALFNELQGDASLSQAQKEDLAISYAKTVVKMVNGFSDYRDEFWCIDPFLVGCIQTMSLNVMKACVDAGKIMYSTHESDVAFREDWARAVNRRCAEFLNDISNHPEQIGSVGLICDCIRAVDDAGYEYSDLLQADSDLSAAIDAALKFIESLPSDSSKARGNPNKTAIKTLQGIKAIVISGQEKMELLEKSIDLASKKYKQWGTALLDAQNMSCTDSPADLAMQVRASTGPLTTAALQILRECTEAKGAGALLNAGCWIAHILEPWMKHPPNPEASAQRRAPPSMEEYLEHRRQKRSIASSLKASGCIELLFKQLDFWAIEWNGMYGDCGGPILRSLYYMMENFPEEVKSELISRPAVVRMIRQAAGSKRYRNKDAFFGVSEHFFEDEGIVCIRMERFIDGLSSDVTDSTGDRETPSAAAAST
jgi:hypothetical protein